MNNHTPRPPDVQSLNWFKAKASSDNGACVEVADARPWIAVRDSKNLSGPNLMVPAGAFARFVNALRTDSL
jgi:hypothetical protein